MKKWIRKIAGICVLSIMFCSVSVFAMAAGTGDTDGTAQPWYLVYPDPDLGGGYQREELFTMTAAQVTDFLASNGSYIGRTNLSGTHKFGYKFTLYHSLAEVTNNFAMRGGVCYWDFSSQVYKPVSFINSSTNGATLTDYIEKGTFIQDTVYRGYVKNLMGAGYVYGTLTFFRVLSP